MQSATKVSTSKPRPRNRILMLCTALYDKDTPQWPFWKFQHLKATRGVTDFAMLAVTRQDSFIATIQNGVASTRNLKKGIKTVDHKLLTSFFDAWYKPGSYFVYGGHGCSDLLEFDDSNRLQVHELSDAMGDRQFNGILFDACLMSSLDTAYYLRKNTRYIGASEGYMWEEDTWAENHMFNPYSAALMSRDSNAARVLQMIGEEYTSKSKLADFSLIDTSQSEQLWNRVHGVHWNDMVSQINLKPEVHAGTAPVVLSEPDGDVPESPHSSEPQVPTWVAPATTAAGVEVPRDYQHRMNFTIPHSLYPAQWDEDHIADLGCYIKDDPVTMEMLSQVVKWKAGPSSTELYSAEALHGLNISFGQYSYQSVPKKLVGVDDTATAAVAPAVAEKLPLAKVPSAEVLEAIKPAPLTISIPAPMVVDDSVAARSPIAVAGAPSVELAAPQVPMAVAQQLQQVATAAASTRKRGASASKKIAKKG